MSQDTAVGGPTHLDPVDPDPARLHEAVAAFAADPVYDDHDAWVVTDNPYRRPLHRGALADLDFSLPLHHRTQATGAGSLAAHRMLTCIYETDLVFLPRAGFGDARADFDRFYSPANRHRGEAVRPALERYAFGLFDHEVDVSGRWDRAALVEYLHAVVEQDDGPSRTDLAVRASTDPERAARLWLVQAAPDYLSEASAMIRNVLGNWGPGLSEWFKIIIDEYGNGVHTAKHSTLFEDTLDSVGLRSDIHPYWQFYLPSSLLMTNYFHYLGRNHELLFRFLGALHHTESTLIAGCRDAIDTLRGAFGDRIDLTYFSEHVHIDVHHSRMMLENLILPVVESCGESVIPDIVRGVEEYRLVSEVTDRDLADQITWIDRAADYRARHDELRASPPPDVPPPVRSRARRGDRVPTHTHDDDRLCHVESGTLRLVTGPDSGETLSAGQGILVPAHRLCGWSVESDECVYEVSAVGDGRR